MVWCHQLIIGPHTETNDQSHSHLYTTQSVIGILLDCGRKHEYLWETHTCTRRTCKVQIGKTGHQTINQCTNDLLAVKLSVLHSFKMEILKKKKLIYFNANIQLNITLIIIHISIIFCLFPFGVGGGALEHMPAIYRQVQVTPWTVNQSIAGPHNHSYSHSHIWSTCSIQSTYSTYQTCFWAAGEHANSIRGIYLGWKLAQQPQISVVHQ